MLEEKLSEEDNFQVLNMKYKLKKIKKRKQKEQKVSTRGKVNNISNIETFEILNNLSVKKEPDKIIEGYSTVSNNSMADNKYEDICDAKDPNCEDWTGGDDVNSETDEGETIQQKIIDFINKLYATVIGFNCLLSMTIVNNYKDKKDNTKLPKDRISWGFVKDNINVADIDNPIQAITYNFDEDTLNDSNSMYHYICLFEVTIITYIILFVWYHQIFYMFAQDQHSTSIFDYITRSKFRNSLNPIIKLIFFFMEYAIVLLDNFRWVLYDFIPNYTSIFGKALCFVGLFVFLFFINYKMLFSIKQNLISILEIDEKNLLIILLYIIVFGTYIRSYSPYDNDDDSDEGKIAKMMNQAMNYMSGNIAVQIIMFIVEVFRIICIAFFAVPFGIILCVLYFLWISIVTNIYSMFSSDVRNDIINFIRADLDSAIIMDTSPAKQGTFTQIWNGIMNLFTYFLMFIFNYLLFIILIIYTSYVLGKGFMNITNFKLSNMLQVLSMCLLILTVVLFVLFLTILQNNGYTTMYEMFILPPIEYFKSMTTVSFNTIAIFFILVMFTAFIYAISTVLREKAKAGVKAGLNNAGNAMKSGLTANYLKAQSYVNRKINKVKQQFE